MNDPRPINCRLRAAARNTDGSCDECDYRNPITCPFTPPPERISPIGYHSDAALELIELSNQRRIYPRFNEALVHFGITADQAREAAHVLNQLSEYLDALDRPISRPISSTQETGNASD